MGLHIEALSAWYGQARALWDITLDIPDGEIVGVLGRNGAGKSTLLRSIAGLQSKISGRVEADGIVLNGSRPDVIARRGLALVRESGRLPSSLTVLQNLILGQRLAKLRKKAGRSLSEIWQWFPLLEPLQDRRAGLLSGGQRQALALAVAFISEPSIMLLDEPSAGLAPPVARELFATIGKLAASGVTILAVEQHPAWLVGIAKQGYLLEVGRVVAEGPFDSLVKGAGSKVM